MSVGEDACAQIIKDSWIEGSRNINMERVMKMIECYSGKLVSWNINSFGKVQYQLNKAKLKLKHMQELDPNCPGLEDNISK